jgi:hypothetical protein
LKELDSWAGLFAMFVAILVGWGLYTGDLHCCALLPIALIVLVVFKLLGAIYGPKK